MNNNKEHRLNGINHARGARLPDLQRIAAPEPSGRGHTLA